jgi:hypothetical protein
MSFLLSVAFQIVILSGYVLSAIMLKVVMLSVIILVTAAPSKVVQSLPLRSA